MYQFEVLVQGYSKPKNNRGEGFTSSSVVLVWDENIKIIVDPGIDRNKFLSALKKTKLKISQIDYIILTHKHLDHCCLSGLFSKAKILDIDSIYAQDGKVTLHKGSVPSSDIQIIPTPGHDKSHCSIIFDNNEYGRVVIAGDIFRWYDNEEQLTDQEYLLNLKDPYGKDPKALYQSRLKLLNMADYIIPGHGKPFKYK